MSLLLGAVFGAVVSHFLIAPTISALWDGWDDARCGRDSTVSLILLPSWVHPVYFWNRKRVSS